MVEGDPHTATLEAAARTDSEHRDAVTKRVAQLGGEGFFRETFGLGIDELSTHVEYGRFEGPLLDAVVDEVEATKAEGERCPVGGDLAEAYAEEGLDGVTEKLTAMGQLAGTRRDEDGNKVQKFNVIVTDSTKAYEDQKKK